MNPKKKNYYILSAIFFALGIVAVILLNTALGPAILLLPVFVIPFLAVSVVFFFLAFIQHAGGEKDILIFSGGEHKTTESIRQPPHSLLTPTTLVGVGVIVVATNHFLASTLQSYDSASLTSFVIVMFGGFLFLLGLGIFLKRIMEKK